MAVRGEDGSHDISREKFFSSQAFRMHSDIANTAIKTKLDQWFWGYNTFNKDKGMLSNSHNQSFVLKKQLGNILTLPTWGRI
jgi:hypothetical protein